MHGGTDVMINTNRRVVIFQVKQHGESSNIETSLTGLLGFRTLSIVRILNN
jgi:hypothetical protein